jgi:hypothetical protein
MTRAAEPPGPHGYPRLLAAVEGPIPRDRVERVLAGMGDEGRASRALAARGFAPPELATGLTLALLQGQPRRPRSDGATPPGAVAGRVWVRERFTLHAPLPLDAPLVMTGATLRRYARKGRVYTTTASQTCDASGRLLAANQTTGLERYRPDPARGDFDEGVAEAQLTAPAPDPEAARRNPCVEAIRALRPGDLLVGAPVEISLERLRARDGPVPSNPIHSDPEAARAAGLDVPIAGGAHVLAFVQELLLGAWGDEALFHGAHLDVRWTAPVRAGTTLVPRAEVMNASPGEVVVALEARCQGVAAMVARLLLPLPPESAP